MSTDSQEQVATLPVAEVTLLEDRAHVIRRGSLSLTSGRQVFVVRGVAPVLADKTLTASLTSPHAKLIDATVRRRVIHKVADQSAPLRELRERARALARELAALHARRDRLAKEAASLAALSQTTHQEFAEDVSWGRADTSSWGGHLDAIRAEETELRETLVALAFE